ncbi:hypothetical protein RYX36_020766 [Vicia faba]
MRFQYVILMLIGMSAFMVVRNQVTLGGWIPIKNINDPHVTSIATYAVTEYDKQSGSKLKLEKVISGETCCGWDNLLPQHFYYYKFCF